MKPRLYIAASSDPAERPRVDAVFAALAPHYEIVGDWRSDIDKHGANPTEGAAEFARKDLDAVASAQVLLFLVPETVSRGAWVELGAALAQEFNLIVASGENLECSVFTAMTTLQFRFDAEAIDRLIAGAVFLRRP